MSMVNRTRRLLLAFIFALLQACMTPAQHLNATAAEFGFTALTLPGDGYRLSAFARHGDTHGNVLHIYIEGDGTPWATPTVAAKDPTSRNPFMLRMMALDPAPSLYLGRPCYNGHAADPGCSTLTWTESRYSATVVASMVSALSAFLKDHPYPGRVFMGHSGGGALALLMAPRFRSTQESLRWRGILISISGRIITDTLALPIPSIQRTFPTPALPNGITWANETRKFHHRSCCP